MMERTKTKPLSRAGGMVTSSKLKVMHINIDVNLIRRCFTDPGRIATYNYDDSKLLIDHIEFDTSVSTSIDKDE